jgi:hypothetical protein
MNLETFYQTLGALLDLPPIVASNERIVSTVSAMRARANVSEARARRIADLEAQLAERLKTVPPVDRETLAMELHNAHKSPEKWGETSERMRDWWRVVADAALRLISAESVPGAARTSDLANVLSVSVTTPWADLMHQVERLRAALDSTRSERNTQKQMRLDLVAEQDKLVAALNEAQDQLAAERKKWPDLKAENEMLRRDGEAIRTSFNTCDQARYKAVEEVQRLERANTALKAEVERFKSELVAVRVARLWAPILNPWPTSSQATVKPVIDRDRIRLALLDWVDTPVCLGPLDVNRLADHLVEKLK